tara:strand:+ start:3971 stop:4072 length:102 start_codon:yes stop_codon:yes gene_type:complete
MMLPEAVMEKLSLPTGYRRIAPFLAPLTFKGKR